MPLSLGLSGRHPSGRWPSLTAMADDVQDLSGTTYERVRMRDSRFRWADLSGSEFRQVGLQRVKMRGVEIVDADIDGELVNVVINGVDVAPLIEAELVRQDP